MKLEKIVGEFRDLILVTKFIIYIRGKMIDYGLLNFIIRTAIEGVIWNVIKPVSVAIRGWMIDFDF